MDLVLYGHWVESNTTSTVSFKHQMAGRRRSTQSQCAQGTVITLPRNLTKKGSVLMRWVDHMGLSAEFGFVVPPHNVTLHADWLIAELSDAEGLLSFTNNVNELEMTYEGSPSPSATTPTWNPLMTLPRLGSMWGLSFDGTFDGRECDQEPRHHR